MTLVVGSSLERLTESLRVPQDVQASHDHHRAPTKPGYGRRDSWRVEDSGQAFGPVLDSALATLSSYSEKFHSDYVLWDTLAYVKLQIGVPPPPDLNSGQGLSPEPSADDALYIGLHQSKKENKDLQRVFFIAEATPEWIAHPATKITQTPEWTLLRDWSVERVLRWEHSLGVPVRPTRPGVVHFVGGRNGQPDFSDILSVVAVSAALEFCGQTPPLLPSDRSEPGLPSLFPPNSKGTEMRISQARLCRFCDGSPGLKLNYRPRAEYARLVTGYVPLLVGLPAIEAFVFASGAFPTLFQAETLLRRFSTSGRTSMSSNERALGAPTR